MQTCVKLFKSDAMFLLLSNLTGLKLHELAGATSEESSDSEEGETSTSNGEKKTKKNKQDTDSEGSVSVSK